MEALAQSEVRLKEQVSALEGEKQELQSTVTRLQDLLSSLSIHTTTTTSTTEEHALTPSHSERHAAAAKVEVLANRTVDSHPHPLALPEGS